MNSHQTVIHRAQSTDGISLHLQDWLPPIAARAALVMVHGVGEHCERFGTLVEAVTARGIAVHGFDQRGHGRSEGRRGHIQSWSDYRNDLVQVVERVRHLHDGAPVFLYGHSMGSLVALDAVRHGMHAIAGVSLSGSAFEPAGVAKPHLIFMARAMSRFWPTFRIKLPLHPERMIADPLLRANWEHDPLKHRTVTARWGTEALSALAEARANASQFSKRVLLMHGEDDPVNLASGALWFFNTISSQDKRIHVYPNSRHEPHNDHDRNRAAADLAQWIDDGI